MPDLGKEGSIVFSLLFCPYLTNKEIAGKFFVYYFSFRKFDEDVMIAS